MGKLKGVFGRKMAWGLVSLLAVVEQASAATLNWSHVCEGGVEGTKEYVIEARSSLSDPWTQIGTVPATPCDSGQVSKTFSFPITLTGSSCFYRVGAVPASGWSSSGPASDSSSESGSDSGSDSGSGTEIPSTVEE